MCTGCSSFVYQTLLCLWSAYIRLNVIDAAVPFKTIILFPPNLQAAIHTLDCQPVPLSYPQKSAAGTGNHHAAEFIQFSCKNAHDKPQPKNFLCEYYSPFMVAFYSFSTTFSTFIRTYSLFFVIMNMIDCIFWLLYTRIWWYTAHLYHIWKGRYLWQ